MDDLIENCIAAIRAVSADRPAPTSLSEALAWIEGAKGNARVALHHLGKMQAARAKAKAADIRRKSKGSQR